MNIIFLRSVSVAAVWSPADLFASSEVGAWYDPSDLSTMWKDTAGTTPVTADGDLVARIDDKSGNGFNATQSTEAGRPVYKTSGGLHWLEFDGSDDFLVTGSINPGAVDKAQVFAGLRHLASAVAYARIVNFDNGGAGSFQLNHTWGSDAQYGFLSEGTVQAFGTASWSATPTTAILTALAGIGDDLLKVRLNGTETINVTDNQGTGNFNTQAMNIGNAGGFFHLKGRLYGLIVRFSAANLDAGVIDSAEAWMNGKTGAY